MPYETTPLDSLIHYPEEAVKNRIEGKVELQAFKDGWADEVKIENSSNPVFNTEAIRVMISTHFEHDPSSKFPPVRMLISRTITFDLKNMRSLVTTSHNSDAYSLLVLIGWSNKDGLMYDDSRLQNIADLDPADYKPPESIPLDSLIYPKEARKKGIEGNVMLQALIEKEGDVSKVEIFKSGDSIFNDEAIRLLKKARFSPNSGNGWSIITINFSLNPAKSVQVNSNQRRQNVLVGRDGGGIH